MDRSISTPVKNNLFGTTWKSDINKLIEFKDKFSRVKNIELYLPYAAIRDDKKSNLEFSYIDEKKYKNFKRLEPEEMWFMNLFLREGHNKQTFGIELTTNAEVIPQLYNRKRWYYYSWDKKQLTIRRMLGTYNINKIERMIQELLEEYKRFYMMYCKLK
jgi:hypothetical protein